MAESYSLQVGMLFDVDFDTVEEVLAIRKQAKRLLFEGKTVMGWTGQTDSSTLQWTLPIDYVLSECRYFLRRKLRKPIVTAARQLRF